MNYSVWVILPARKGSKGVKSKNSKFLGDKPLIAHTIHTLKKSKCFDKIIVTSDSKKILSVAKENRVLTHFRTNPLHSNDYVMPELPTMEIFENIEKKKWPKYVFMAHCTSPFIKAGTFRSALSILKKNPDGTVFAAHESHFFLWKENKLNKNKKNFLPISHPFKKRLGRQFMDKQINETGAFYGFKTENLMKYKHRFFSEAFPCIIKGIETIDINDKDDWEYAEYIVKKNANKSKK